jgi:hypothetical protein
MSGGWTVVDANTNRSQPITGVANSGAVSPYFMPAPGQQDPVGKMRVSSPQALIDTDFEYGQQPTKWESISLQNNRQSCYYIPQQPRTVTSVTGDGSSRTVVVNMADTTGFSVGSLIYVQNSSAPNANGWFMVSAVTASTSVSYIASGVVANGNQYNQALTYVYLGYFYSSCGMLLSSTTAFTYSGTTVTCTTASAHGLSVGSLIYVTGTTASTNAPNGAWVVATVPTANTFTFTVVSAPTGTISNTANNTTLYARPGGYVESRAFDGGVAFSAGATVPNSQLIRQTRRYFRYQSGKGIQFSTGTSLKPAIFTTSITALGTTATVTTRFNHNLAAGCVVQIQGCDQGIYNGTFKIVSVPTANTFTYTLPSTPSITTVTGLLIKISPVSWYGSSNRVGFFDQQNGMFFEFDGQTLYAVWRTSTNQLSGTVQVTQGSATVTGSGTQFTTQVIPGDFIVIRGQSYRVITVTSDTQMYISPEYRGSTINQGGAVISKTIDTKVPQSQWTDPLDGTGPSGYNLDLTKMQMFYIDYSWYGAGFIRWGLRTSRGQITYVYQQTNNNQQFEAYMRSGNMAAHYESSGLTPYTILASSLSAGGTTTTSAAVALTDVSIPLTSATNFSAPGVATIGSETIYYNGISSNTLTGCTRGFNNTAIVPIASGATVTPNSINAGDASKFSPAGTVKVQANGTSGVVEYIAYGNKYGNVLYNLTRAQTGGQASAQSFTYSATAPVAVEYATPDTVASLSHWGSSVIMDGLFNDDKSLIFNYGMTTAITTTNTNPIILLAIRIAPAVDNGQSGLLGDKEIVNHMQLQLTELGLYTTGTGYLINLILNGYASGATSGSFVSPIQQANGITSSFSQVALNTNAVRVASGESVAAAYTQTSGATTLDLTKVRDLGNSILGGGTSSSVPTAQSGFYPDGPDILYVVATPLTSTSSTILARLSWTEAQA